MTAQFRLYEEGDIFKVDAQEGDDLGEGEFEEAEGLAWTMVRDEKVLACLGVFPLGGNMATAWLIASEDVRAHGVQLARYCLETLDATCEVLELQRVQTTVRTDRDDYCRWVEFLGFEKEGRMRKATPTGDDLFIYARVM